jgi:hypothetical protein
MNNVNRIVSKTMVFKFIVFVIACVLASCSKDDEVQLDEKTKLLTQKAWQFYGAKYSNGTDEKGIAVGVCKVDDNHRYSASGKYSINIGTKKCSDTETNTSGSWKWNDGETAISITTTTTTEYNVVSLSATALELDKGHYSVDVDDDGTPEDAILVEMYKAVD